MRLVTLAMKARIDSFTEVKKAIQNMTESLEKEQKDEASRPKAKIHCKSTLVAVRVSLNHLGSGSRDCMRLLASGNPMHSCKVKERK